MGLSIVGRAWFWRSADLGTLSSRWCLLPSSGAVCGIHGVFQLPHAPGVRWPQIIRHGSCPYIRQRWSEERFQAIFHSTVRACLEAKFATAEVVHIDASLIRADVSWKGLVERHADDVMAGNRRDEEVEAEKKGRQSGKYKKVSRTDPEASMVTTASKQRLAPCYKQHAAVDDARGVVLDVAVTTGEVNEGDTIEAQVDEVRTTSAREIGTVTADERQSHRQVARHGRLSVPGPTRRIPQRTPGSHTTSRDTIPTDH